MASQAKPKHAAKALREAAKVVQGSLVDDRNLSSDLRDDASWLVDYLRWLADYHSREYNEARRHVCADSRVLVLRMMLALAERDEHAYELIVAELGECQTCWANTLRQAMVWCTSDSMLRAGGFDKLADTMAAELERMLMS